MPRRYAASPAICRPCWRGSPSAPASGCPTFSLLALAERHELLCEWNEAALDGISRPTPTVADLVERRAAEAPARVAVEARGQSLTYGELSARSDRLARRLAALGLGPEDRVGLLLDRTVGVAVALLGMWKAGAACVPLDPEQPEARLAWLAEDAGLAALVTSRGRRPACIDGKTLPVRGPRGSPT